MAYRIGRLTRSLPFVLLIAVAQGDDAEKAKSGGPVAEKLSELELYVTNWNVVAQYFNENGEQVGTVKGTEDIVWALGHRVIQRTFTTLAESAVYRAIGLLTWNEATERFEGVYFDNISTSGPTTVEAQWNKKKREMVSTLKSTGSDGSTIKYRIVDKFIDDSNRVATTYSLAGNKQTKVMEAKYARAVPCPSTRRRLIDELNP
ncbi:MAG: DUF1579 family protein [Phycisphaerales bacterium]|nr:MAG: DUF1579 family protein [Phycisphaerales bacterium]